MPIDYARYPENWQELRSRVLERAGHCCERCGVPNRTTRDGVEIVLTIAHLDHDEWNMDVQIDRLQALCQRCHIRYDAPEKARRMKYGRQYRRQPQLFGDRNGDM